ncbi:MAG: T9SS type A sorting domain-containing protein, partial [Bacteroidales bacterium]|nr:T9SS type A sorting domain-containing protein [Bacteroidales bacterium]
LLETENEDYILTGTRSLGPADNYQRIISFTEYNSDGQFVSEKEITGESHLTLQFINEIENGGYIIGGYSGFQYPEGSCLFIAKLEANGDTIWTKKYKNITTVLNSSIFETQNEQFIVVGTWRSSITSGNQIFLMWIDTDGNIVWKKSQLLDKSNGYCVRQTFDKGFVLTGSTEKYGNGQNDLLILKTSILGDSTWAKIYGGANSDYGYEIKQTSDSGFIVLGSSDSFGQTGSYLIKTDNQGDVACRLDHNAFFTPGISSISVDIYSELTTVGFDPVFGDGKVLLYKESNITGKYNIVNTLQNFETGVVNDTSSYPATKAHRYMVRIINECGDTSLYSLSHKSIFLEVYDGGNNIKSLIWNHYEGANVISYEILRGADMNTLSVIDSIPGSINIYSDLNPPAGEIMYQIKGVLSGDNNDTYISYSNATTHVATNVLSMKPEQSGKFKIYPNPVYGQSIVEFSNPDNEKYDCFIIDISGRIIRSYSNLRKSSFVFNKEELAAGIYFIELRGPKIIRERIIIK